MFPTLLQLLFLTAVLIPLFVVSQLMIPTEEEKKNNRLKTGSQIEDTVPVDQNNEDEENKGKNL